MTTSDAWSRFFHDALKTPHRRARLNVALLDMLAAARPFGEDELLVELTDDYDARTRSRKGLAWLSWTTLPDFSSHLAALTKTDDASQGIVLAPLLHFENSEVLQLPIRVLGQDDVIRLIHERLSILLRHVPEALGPAIQYAVQSDDAEWRKERQERLERLRADYQNGDVTLVLGAGISKDAGLPSWRELLDNLMIAVVRANQHSVEIPELTIKQAAGLLSTFVNDSPLISAAAVKAGLADEVTYQNALHTAVYGGEAKPSELLNEIVELCRATFERPGPKAVITYNFDDLLEEHLTKAMIPFETIVSADVGALERRRTRNRRSARGRLPVIHVHGFLPRNLSRGDAAASSVMHYEEPVLSEDRYHSLYGAPFAMSNVQQLDLFRNTTCFFVGTSMTDPNQRRLLTAAVSSGGAGGHYAIMRRQSIPDAKSVSPAIADVSPLVARVYHQIQEISFELLGVSILWIEELAETAALVRWVRGGDDS